MVHSDSGKTPVEARSAASIEAILVDDIVHAAASEQDTQQSYTPMLDTVRQLIDDCEVAGEIDFGAAPDDFLVFADLLWKISPTSAGEARVGRLLALAFKGLGAENR